MKDLKELKRRARTGLKQRSAVKELELSIKVKEAKLGKAVAEHELAEYEAKRVEFAAIEARDQAKLLLEKLEKDRTLKQAASETHSNQSGINSAEKKIYYDRIASYDENSFTSGLTRSYSEHDGDGDDAGWDLFGGLMNCNAMGCQGTEDDRHNFEEDDESYEERKKKRTRSSSRRHKELIL